MEIFAPFDQAVYEKYSNIPEAVKERKDDSAVLELHDITEYEAAQIVTKACGNAKVHHPEQLKKFIRSIANKILEYQDE